MSLSDYTGIVIMCYDISDRNGGQNPGGQNPGEICVLGQNPGVDFQGGGRNPRNF